jgi:hypothetical protein
MRRWLPGVVLPVNPSTLLVWKYLQKFDPSDYPSGGVNNPSGIRGAANELTARERGRSGGRGWRMRDR